MAKEAVEYFQGFTWCKAVRELWFSGGIGKIIAVFCAGIEHIPGVDDWLWLLVGDLPSAYMPLEVGSSAQEVVEAYVELVEDWIRAVETREHLREVFPLKAPPDDLVHGRSGIPEAWLEALELRDVIERLGHDLCAHFGPVNPEPCDNLEDYPSW